MENNVVPLNTRKRDTYKTNYVIEEKLEDEKMSTTNYVTKEQLSDLEEKIDLKIKVAIQPIEGKIDNLPTQFENLLLKERQHQDDKTKETRRYIWGTIGIGLLSIFVSVVLNFI